MVFLRRDPLANPRAIIRRVYSYVAYRIGDGADAEDVTSDVVERMLRYRDRYDPSVGSPTAWALGVARTVVADHLAQRRPLALEENDLEITVRDDGFDKVDARLTLQETLASLSENDRDLLALRYGADLSARDIGELLGQRTNTVEVALHRALARTRRLLEQPPAERSETGAQRV